MNKFGTEDRERGSGFGKPKRFSRRRPQQRCKGQECDYCGFRHPENRELCPAHGQECRTCGMKNHFSSKCRQEVKATEEVEDEAEEMYQTDEVSAVKLDDSQLVTLQLESGSFIRFQPDTGAQCNVLPVHTYKKASKDERLEKVQRMETSLVAYGGSKIKVIGRVPIGVWRNSSSYLLDCRLVNNEDIRPILGRKACVGMGILEYHDNDLLNKPETGDAPLYAVKTQDAVLSKEEFVAKFPKVFSDGVGKLEEYKIRLDPTVQPVQHAPRCVAVALRPKLKETLDDLVVQNVITPVTRPTAWINSIVAAPKKSGKLRVCLDPKDLNRAILRENYQMPTIEDIATRLHGAKVFTVLHVRNGFWHVSLDEESSFLTTFQTPFGRYRWKRMPFGISSAPEVFQRKMHKLIEGLNGIEVVADDFIAVGYGDTYEEASQNHNRCLLAFLRRCEERNVRLNPEKVKLRQTKVLFIGHVATDNHRDANAH